MGEEAWRRGLVNERGRGAAFGAPVPTITRWGEVASSVASALLACHASSMHLGLRWWRRKTGPTRVDVEGRPRRLPFLYFDWLGGAAEPPLCPFIRSGRGR